MSFLSYLLSTLLLVALAASNALPTADHAPHHRGHLQGHHRGLHHRHNVGHERGQSTHDDGLGSVLLPPPLRGGKSVDNDVAHHHELAGQDEVHPQDELPVYSVNHRQGGQESLPEYGKVEDSEVVDETAECGEDDCDVDVVQDELHDAADSRNEETQDVMDEAGGPEGGEAVNGDEGGVEGEIVDLVDLDGQDPTLSISEDDTDELKESAEDSPDNVEVSEEASEEDVNKTGVQSDEEGNDVPDDYSDTSDNLDLLRQSIPGEPGQDYPILNSIPETNFKCDENIRSGGLYGDRETGCQVYHVCVDVHGVKVKHSFICPNGTIFNDQHSVCEWWFNVDCSANGNDTESDGNHIGPSQDSPLVHGQVEVESARDAQLELDQLIGAPEQQEGSLNEDEESIDEDESGSGIEDVLPVYIGQSREVEK